MCATNSLIQPSSLENELSIYSKEGLVDKSNTSAWDTGNGVFKFPGTVQISKVHLPIFTKNRKFSVKFHIMPKKEKNKNSYKVIIGMKDLRRLRFIIDLDDNFMKWQGINVPMVPRGYWSQDNIDASLDNQVDVDVTEEQPMFEYHGTVLSANKYEPADIDATLEGEKYDHLNSEQKQQLRTILKQHEGLFQGKRGVFNGPDVTLKLKPDAKNHFEAT